MTNDRKKHFKQMAADFYYVVVPPETVDWIEGTSEEPKELDVESLYHLLVNAYETGMKDSK